MQRKNPNSLQGLLLRQLRPFIAKVYMIRMAVITSSIVEKPGRSL